MTGGELPRDAAAPQDAGLAPGLDAGTPEPEDAALAPVLDANVHDAAPEDASSASNCDAGFDAAPEACGATVDECATDDGGCDPLTECTSVSGGVACACPTGYTGDGNSGCAPTLTALTVTGGTLDPAFAPGATHYVLTVAPGATSISVTPASVPGAGIAIDGTAVASGDTWSSQPVGLGTNPITITVSQPRHRNQVYTIEVQREIGALQPSVSHTADRFGASVGMSGDTIVVGAPHEDASAASREKGAAFVFVRAAGVWSEQSYLKAPNGDPQDRFGTSVAISGDTLVVGAPGESSAARGINNNVPGPSDNSAMSSGAVYVFVRSGTVWTEQAYLKASNADANDGFGVSVAIADDTIVVGAYAEASGGRGVDPTNPGPGDNSAALVGAAYVFVRSAGVWSQQAYLKPSDAAEEFGMSVALANDTIVVGAPLGGGISLAGAAYVFVRNAGKWTWQSKIEPSFTQDTERFGDSVTISGNSLVVGAQGESSAFAGLNSTGPWPMDQSLPLAGAGFEFERSGTSWLQRVYIKASNPGYNDDFGFRVALAGDVLAIGAPLEASSATGVNPLQGQSGDSASDTGAVYVFVRSAGIWSQRAYVKPPIANPGGEFGSALAISGTTIVVGAPQVGFAKPSGAVYIY